MACNVTHPEHPQVRCLAKDGRTHDQHFAMHAGQPLEWKNEDWAAPPPKTRRSRGSAAQALKDLADRVPKAQTAVGLRNEALQRVEANSSEDFKTAARDGLRRVALAQAELTAEDVQDLIGIEAHDNRAWGPVMTWGVKEGLIEKTDPEKFVQSRFPRRHLMDVRVWRSLVHRG